MQSFPQTTNPAGIGQATNFSLASRFPLFRALFYDGFARTLGVIDSIAKPITRLDTLQRVELTEGVAIRLRTAGPMVRMLALMIDILIQFGSILAISFLFGILVSIFGFDDTGGVIIGLFLITLFVVFWGYFIFFEYGKRNATPGKRCFGLRVARFSGAPPTLGQVVIRNLLRFIDFFPLIPLGSFALPTYAFGLAACALTRNFQRLGDLAADTVVVYNDPKPLRRDIRLDLKVIAPQIPLTREEQLAIASFVDRIGDWSDERRREIADIVTPLTGASGEEGVRRLLGIGLWIRSDGEEGAKRF